MQVKRHGEVRRNTLDQWKLAGKKPADEKKVTIIAQGTVARKATTAIVWTEQSRKSPWLLHLYSTGTLSPCLPPMPSFLMICKFLPPYMVHNATQARRAVPVFRQLHISIA
ncbi:hypothetical protein BR93DRAFT_193110 [Coniochaeta sp. PMI_546]|nr:hypothetical protein BR93DRAFT_193110 [Coniochaeta sp. PMI_546]